MRSFLVIVFSCVFVVILSSCAAIYEGDRVLLADNFGGLEVGMFSTPVGPHTEYHYLPEAAPKGNWAVSCFASKAGAQRAWYVRRENGTNVMEQTFNNKGMMDFPNESLQKSDNMIF